MKLSLELHYVFANGLHPHPGAFALSFHMRRFQGLSTACEAALAERPSRPKAAGWGEDPASDRRHDSQSLFPDRVFDSDNRLGQMPDGAR